MEGDGCFRTSDMALATFLATRHIVHRGMELTGNEVVWLIPESEALSRELDDYRLGQARVEPVEFTRQMTRTRREMFQFKEHAQRAA